MQFKEGDTVRCIETIRLGRKRTFLTAGNFYKITKVSPTNTNGYTSSDNKSVWVVNDLGKDDWFRPDRFEISKQSIIKKILDAV